MLTNFLEPRINIVNVCHSQGCKKYYSVLNDEITKFFNLIGSVVYVYLFCFNFTLYVNGYILKIINFKMNINIIKIERKF